ncbi:MAG TPA: OadG family protein [Bacteroidales bacterium]|jgi:Na+-transporting methylmalonyl-CoA/oxaloacetate decarboxylase gamma subunit|nr:OadG family protein [Bacteroidales bacterium]
MMISTILLIQTGERVPGKAAAEFGQMDPSGFAMTIIAMGVVFTSLILLYLAFKYIAKLYNVDIKRRFRKSSPEETAPETIEDIPGETLAAISLAIHMYSKQLQGLEEAVMTIRSVSKTYSPWSSKIYGLRQNPKR